MDQDTLPSQFILILHRSRLIIRALCNCSNIKNIYSCNRRRCSSTFYVGVVDIYGGMEEVALIEVANGFLFFKEGPRPQRDYLIHNFLYNLHHYMLLDDLKYKRLTPLIYIFEQTNGLFCTRN